MTINEILKMIRKEINASQETLARELNVSYATLNRVITSYSIHYTKLYDYTGQRV